MAINSKLLAMLVRSGVEYEVLPHREAFTAVETAQVTHVGARRLAKVVVLRARDRYLMVALPASSHVDLEILGHRIPQKELALASEREVKELFPDCEVGAMPPVGHLYGLPLYLDACFFDQENIYFQAGNHREVIRMAVRDYLALAHPYTVIECVHATPAPAHA